MTSTRVPIPATNLKERIAALEQRNSTIGGAASRSVSPTPGAGASSTNSAQLAGAFRDKIAKFERKGGVPVPRGRFGLGAPPVSYGPSRQGELYGNRIPAQARVASMGSAPSMSRATSPTGSPPVPGQPGDRRSFSMSSVADTDFDDDLHYTPVGSPTFNFPPESPDSLVTLPQSPEQSPEPLSTNGEVATFTRPVVRATSFQKALELARNAEQAKLEGGRDLISPVHQLSLDSKEEPEKQPLTSTNVSPDEPTFTAAAESPVPEATPAIVVSSEEATPVVVHESPISKYAPTPQESPVFEYLPTTDSVVSPTFTISPTVSEASAPLSADIGGGTPINSPVEEPQIPSKVIVPTIVVAPLNIRKLISLPRSQDSIDSTGVSTSITLSRPSSTEPTTEEASPEEVNPEEVNPEEVSPAEATIAPPPTVPEETTQPWTPKELTQVEETPMIEIFKPLSSPHIPLPITIEVTAPTSNSPTQSPVKTISEVIQVNELSPTSPVATDKPATNVGSNVDDDFNSRKAALTLDAELINNDSAIMSPPLITDASFTAITNFLTGGLGSDDKVRTFRTVTPPPLHTSVGVVAPLSPEARLAYDSPVSPQPLAPAPASRPRVKPLDPSALLSPPMTSGVLSTGGSSMGSMSSLGSRPMSMIETSPTHVTRALRMTPATSRGVPVYLPPTSSRPRKSDFIYFPPTPGTEEEFNPAPSPANAEVQNEAHPRRGSEPDLGTTITRPATTFTAIVHDKVTETATVVAPPSATVPNRSYVVPATPQMKRVIQAESMIWEPPMSPGQGELATLLQEAVLLEGALSKGELPAENVDAAVLEEEKAKKEREKKTTVEAEAKEKERVTVEKQEKDVEYRRRMAAASAQLQAKRDEPTSGKLKHTFLIPLSKARASHHRKESSAPARSGSVDDVVPPKSAGLPSLNHPTRSDTIHVASSSQPLRPKTPEPEASQKSPKSSRFASLRRLGSKASSRPTTIHGHSSRYSNSTSSEISEDSQAVVTPPENHLEFGVNRISSSVGEFGTVANGSTASFPSLSSKKSQSSLGRATSFAEKMWSRSRTRSGASSNSNASDVTIDNSLRLPTLVPSSGLDIPGLPSIPVNLAPLAEAEEKVLNPPKRSVSLKRSMNLPAVPSEPVPPLPQFSIQAVESSDIPNDSLLPPTAGSRRSSSWTSLSSAGSLPSPLFDQALFDAFPSVPENVPTTNLTLPIRRDTTKPANFDSALLSSAIHLASSQKSAIPATTTDIS